MKSKPVVFILLALVAVAALAAGTVLTLKNIDQGDRPSAGSENKKTEESELGEAESLEKEASRLIDSDPEKAISMLEKAKDLYEKDKNNAKVAEIERNISSAETVINSRKRAEESSDSKTNSDEELKEKEAEDLKGLVVPSDGPSPD